MIFISIERQKLYLIKDEKIVKEYQISTSKYGKGNELGSEKTPTGIHRIYKKIGEGMPEDTYFIGRVPYSKQEAEKKFGDIKDKITARVIWLEGCEEGINKGKNEEGKVVDTKERFIYIHGTPDDISTPSSRGCIRMANKDIIELFELVEEGDLVIIF
jgi:L,D-transpeptidase YbiS